MTLSTEKMHYIVENTIEFLVQAESSKEACRKVADAVAPLIFDFQRKHEGFVKMEEMALTANYRINLDEFGDEGYQVDLDYRVLGNPENFFSLSGFILYEADLISDEEIEDLKKLGIESRRWSYGDHTESYGDGYNWRDEESDEEK